jgi:fructan beta-fructosidase
MKTWKHKAGKLATIEIVDRRTGGWGHINVDNIVQSDTKAASTRVAFSKTLKIDGTHLIVPVANGGKKLLLGIFEGDRLIQNFHVEVPHEGQPYWLAAYPLAHFDLEGKTITFAEAGKKKLPAVLAAALDQVKVGDASEALAADDYDQPYREQFHVTTRRGWNNDPNGMAYHKGKFHLYYQHNPFGIRWGNMHWGHFESRDLVHWEEKPIALYQKTVGDYMFSGGGFVDFNNSAGLGKDTLFAAFTSTGRGECLAYSRDRGLTFTELPENPVVKHKGRDPKVIWYEPEQKWVMVVYSESACEETKAINGNRHIAFYESKNLRQWTRTGGFTHEDQGAVYECPEFFPLEYKGETKWILLGAQNRYFVGDFNGKTFTSDSGPHGSLHGKFYAAQTFSDEPDGRRIQIGWMQPELYLDRFPNRIVNQSFTLPHELTLVETPEGPRMAFNPVKELKKLRDKKLKGLDDCKGELTEVLIEFEEDGHHGLVINGIDASFEGRSARIFTDRTVNEVYANGGLYYEVRARSPQAFESTETVVKNGTIKSVKVYRLKSIWE